jgi:hypothetical protein
VVKEVNLKKVKDMKNFRILTTKTDPEVLIRLPHEVYEEISRLASAKNRSFNTQLLIALTEQLEMLQKNANSIPHQDLSNHELMHMIMGNSCVDFKPVKF